jgi:hypothetical protein
VAEDATIDSTVFNGIQIEDKDLLGDILEVSCSSSDVRECSYLTFEEVCTYTNSFLLYCRRRIRVPDFK